MSIKQKDIKILWGWGASRCAICRCNLAFDSSTTGNSFPLGEQAHIVGEKADSPRGESILTLAERNSYSNLILLCPNHHTEIDKDVESYPVERLHHIKAKHELWVKEKLADEKDPQLEAEDLVVAHLVDLAVEACQLESWNIWTSWALDVHPQWSKDAPDRVEAFARQVISAVWPQGRFDELKRALTTLAHSIHWANKIFMKHAVDKGDHYFGPMFHKQAGSFGEPEERAALKKWEEWIDHCQELIFEATKAANWFADAVRRDVNPMFFATEGRFLVTHGPDSSLKFTTMVLEYSSQERDSQPDAFIERVKETNEFGTRFSFPDD